MADKTGIEWCDSTFNPWIGCTKVSPACDHCYAESGFDHRLHQVKWGAGQPRKRTSFGNWKMPLRWNKQPYCQCPSCGWRGEKHKAIAVFGLLNIAEDWCPACRKAVVQPARRRVFCASLADWLDNEVHIEWFVDLLDLIRRTPDMDWLLLTKRIGNWHKRLEAAANWIWENRRSDNQLLQTQVWIQTWLDGKAPENVWIGSTICNQAEADRDVPKLLDVPARVRFLSMEPLLGTVNLRHLNEGREVNEIDCLKPYTWEEEIDAWRDTNEGWIEQFEDWHEVDLSDGLSGPMHPSIDWVIVGGESGRLARPMHPDWVRSLRDQCAAAGVPFLFKQWGEHTAHAVAPDGDATHLICIDRDGRECALSRGNQARANREGWWFLPPHPGRGTWGPDGIPDGVVEVRRVGKKAAGRLLDGVEHNGFPEVRHA